MSYTSLLFNTCTTRRYPAGGAVDDYGTPAKVFADYLVGIPCRWSTPVNREVKVGAEVVLADLQLFLLDVDITEQHQVVLGVPAKTYEVLSVVRRQDSITGHHVECFIRIVK